MTIYSYYVYAYLREDGTPYYIGKGKDRRAWNASHGINLPPKEHRGTRIAIINNNLSEIGALALERRYIRWYGRKDLGNGILRNLTDGGEGCSGRIMSHTKESKRKISESKKGKVYDAETRAKVAKAQKEHYEKNGHHMTGKKLPKSWRDNIAKVWKDKPLMTCPHCGMKSKSSPNMKRYHYDNCKQKRTEAASN